MLGDVLAAQAFGFLLVFTRIGTTLTIIPALGESVIPVRVRLTMALALSYVIYTVVAPSIPDMPVSPWGLVVLLLSESLIGLMFGIVARLLMSSVHVAGTIIGFQSGLAAAQLFDPTQGQQSALLSVFLTLLAVVVIFTTNLHHLAIAAMSGSYTAFPPGAPVPYADFADLTRQTVASSFYLGVQLATPFIVFGLVYNFGLGIIARLMPQLPIFFIALPLNVGVGFLILTLSISAMMMWFAEHFAAGMNNLIP